MKAVAVLKNILAGLYKSIKRFPLSILFSLSTAIILIVISEMQPIRDGSIREMLYRLAMTAALGIPLSLCIKLLYERDDSKNDIKLAAMYGAGIAALILYYFFLLGKLNMVSNTRYAGISIALYLVFLYIPYLPRRENYEKYVIKVMTSFFITAIYSAVLYGGLSAIWFTVDKLLGVNITSEIYYYTWLAVVFGFAPAYFLTGVPLYGQKLESESFPKLLNILLLYIVMPLLAIYTFILYIYFAKIIFTRVWPQGLVSNLVLWYSVIDAATLFFITPVRHENRWADVFLKWSPRIILPLLAMMFVSMGIRVNAYGITENRYYVIVLGLWVSCIMVYFAFSKKMINVILPVTLSAVAIISVIGPFSSYSVSKWSQNKRFEGILSKNGMLEGRKIKLSNTISSKDKIEISSILNYFMRNHDLKDVSLLPDDFKMENMDKVFGFPYEPTQENRNDYFDFMIDANGGPIDIKGYDYMFESISNRTGNSKNPLDAVYDSQSGILKINHNGKTVYEKNMSSILDELIKKHSATTNKNALPAEDMIFTDENESVKVKFIIKYISGRKDNAGGNVLNGIEFNMLVNYIDDKL